MSAEPTATSIPNVEALAAALAPKLAEFLRAEPDRLFDLHDFAARTGLSPRGITGLIARGELPEGYLIGGCRRWLWSDVLRHIDRLARRRRRKGRGRPAAGAAIPRPADETPAEAGDNGNDS
jgi:hypothetical protein